MRAEHRARRRLRGADTARQAKRSKTQTTKTRNEADPEAVDEIKPRQETVRARLMPARARAKPRGSRRSRGDRDPEGRARRPSRKRARDWEAPWETVTRERYQPLKQRLIPTSQNPQTGSGGTQNSPRHSPGAQMDTVQASRRGDGERRPGGAHSYARLARYPRPSTSQHPPGGGRKAGRALGDADGVWQLGGPSWRKRRARGAGRQAGGARRGARASSGRSSGPGQGGGPGHTGRAGRPDSPGFGRENSDPYTADLMQHYLDAYHGLKCKT